MFPMYILPIPSLPSATSFVFELINATMTSPETTQNVKASNAILPGVSPLLLRDPHRFRYIKSNPPLLFT
jgi:hypothetical protein